jgi:2-aminoadipate transaminase
MAKTLAHPEIVSLAAGFVDHQTLPAEPTRLALEAIWSKPDLAQAALQYSSTIGYPPLRAALLDRMLRADGLTAAQSHLSPGQVVITAGSNQFLHLLGDILLDPGDVVLCGAPTYFVYLGTLTSLGARAVGVETDSEGLIPDALDEQLARFQSDDQLHRVKAVYVTSYYDNPTGATTSADRRAALVDLVRRWSRTHKVYLIEDTAYRELRYYGDDAASMRSMDPDGDTVIVAGSFSKSYSPGIRIGWGILPPALVEPLLGAKGNFDFGSPNFNQVLMATVLEQGLFDAHVETVRARYRQKVEAVLDAAERFLRPVGAVDWVPPSGGLYLWLRLPEGVDTGLAGPLFDRAVAEGVLYLPGAVCFPAEGRAIPANTLRLCFGFPSCDAIRRGVAALGRAMGQVLR